MASLEDRLSDQGFTPAVRDLPALLELLRSNNEDLHKSVERALTRQPEAAFTLISDALFAASPPFRGRLARVIGKLAFTLNNDASRVALLSLLDDSDDKSRRNAIIAAGKLTHPSVETALIARISKETRDDILSSVAEALGKVGTPQAYDALKKLRSSCTGDRSAKLLTSLDKALVMLGRTEQRTQSSSAPSVHLTALSNNPPPVRLSCRVGFEELVRQEVLSQCPNAKVQIAGPGTVLVTGAAPVLLLNAHVWSDLRFALQVQREKDAAATIAATLSSPNTTQLLESLLGSTLSTSKSVSPKASQASTKVRFRIAFAQGGHHRSLVWSVATALQQHPWLVNDPTQSDFELWVEHPENVPHLTLSLRPLDLGFDRFAYRKADVPAASHPTVAAALARVSWLHSDAKKKHVIWDPFVGSGVDLIERHRLGRVHKLWGSDTSKEAIAAASTNARSAQVELNLIQGDALYLPAPQGLTDILTNPPMGRRVQNTGGIKTLLDRFLSKAYGHLPHGGTLVWATPWSRSHAQLAKTLGFTVGEQYLFDMGGFEAEIQHLTKP